MRKETEEGMSKRTYLWLKYFIANKCNEIHIKIHVAYSVVRYKPYKNDMMESFVLENGLQSPLSTSPTNLLSPLSGSPTDSAIESLVCQRPRPLVVSLAHLLNLAKKFIVFRFCI